MRSGVGGVVMSLLALVLAGVALSGAEPNLLLGVVGAALFALGAARHSSAALRAASGRGPATARRHRHRRDAAARVPRQLDPDAPGRTRARAPSGMVRSA
ncbi:hypothetical protein, partial [Pseudonocardia ailaonensis]|uniref:hypothetical protein n=1 Tax=Pseudonocardia ailaonensis TaxID=367279 RepID=UPI0031D4CBE3